MSDAPSLRVFARHELALHKDVPPDIAQNRIRPVRRSAAVCWVETRDAWITARLSPEWIAAYRLAVQDGVRVVAELRVYPQPVATRDVPPGEWPGRMGGLHAPVPRGGLTSTILKAATIGQHVRSFRESFEMLARALRRGARVTRVRSPSFARDGAKVTSHTMDLAAHPVLSRLGPLLRTTAREPAPRHPATRDLYATVAAAYAHGLSATTIAERLTRAGRRTSRAYVTQMVSSARHRLRFLERTAGRGVVGRQLTDAGHAAFAAAPAALQQIATDSHTRGGKARQVKGRTTKKPRQSARKTRRA